MICPRCQAENQDDAARCERCGIAFADIDDSETLEGSASGASAGLSRPQGSAQATGSAGARSRASASQALEPGSELGPRFRIESVIGQGGMGRVYKAYDKELGRVVALKVLLPELTSDPAATQRFKQELLLASKISHKNILRIHDLGEADGVKFISMAYVEGEDLHHLLVKQHPLPIDRSARVARQLCEALEAAHSEGVVHRDLKPQNILVGKDDHVYISDFGLAKSLEASLGGMTRTGAFLGTPRYMSPEQVEGHAVDHRTDLYSLGLILYEMGTGEAPFAGDSTIQVMYQRVKQKPKNPRLVNPDLPDYFARIILRCLEKDPAQRYQSAREILTDLEAGRAPTRAHTVQIALPEIGRRAWLMTGAGALLLVALAFAIPGVRHWILRQPASTGLAPTGVPSLTTGKYLAVLPFRVLGDQSSLGYVAEGLMEALSAKLFQLRDVKMASTAAAGKGDANASLQKIARGLGVNLIVQGMVQGAGDKIRIIVNLEDIADGRRLWSQEFSGVPADLLTLEDQIYGRLVDALALKPTSEEFARAAAHPTENIEAYDLYLKGRNAMRGQQDINNVKAAIGYYEDALKKDSGFALAYAGVADASLAMYREKKDSFWSQKALAAAQQAERLNDNLAEVHFSVGSVYNATGKSAEAITELKRALQLAPNSDEGYRRLGLAYLASGRKDEAIQAFQKALDVNPYYWLNQNALGGAYAQFGENEKALACFRRVTELEPENFFGYANIGAIYFQEGKYNECIPAFQRALQIQPHFALYSNIGTAYYFLKRYNDAVQMFEKAVEMNPNQQVAVGNLADAYRLSGQREKAQVTYDKAIALAYKELEVNPRNASTMGFLALYYARKGDPTRAADFIQRARAIDRADVNLIYKEAIVDALANRPSDALKALRGAFEKGYSTEEAESEPDFAGLHTHPEFQKLVSEFSRKSH
jgi:tetratricopeptide (TPR) repeat protein/TolB-like protein/predicted Ser/Thr protein kinase